MRMASLFVDETFIVAKFKTRKCMINSKMTLNPSMHVAYRHLARLLNRMKHPDPLQGNSRDFFSGLMFRDFEVNV